MELPLEGLVVVEAATFVAAPAAGAILADFGAEVVHIEPPGDGDPYRHIVGLPPVPNADQNFPWILDNRNKRSVALDLKTEAGREVMFGLVRMADVFITNYLPQVIEELSLAYEDLVSINERLIYAHLTGYGELGPQRDRRGLDITAWWARTGLADVVRPVDGEVAFLAPAMGDHATSTALYGAIMTALYRRERTGKGGKVSTSLMANGLWSNGILAQAALCGAEPFERTKHASSTNALISIYRTSDDRYFVLVLLRDEEWTRFCQAIDLPALAADSRFKDHDRRIDNHLELVQVLDRVFDKRSFAEWARIFDESRILFGPVQRIEELADDPQTRANGLLRQMDGRPDQWVVDTPIRLADVSKAAPRPPPELGEHTREALEGLGYDEDAIDALLRARVAEVFDGSG